MVLTSGFYLTALTTAPHPSSFTGKKPSAECRTVGGKQNRGKLASCMFLLRSQCHRGQKHCSPKKTKTKKKRRKKYTARGRSRNCCILAGIARRNTSESCACPERLWQVLGYDSWVACGVVGAECCGGWVLVLTHTQSSQWVICSSVTNPTRNVREFPLPQTSL